MNKIEIGALIVCAFLFVSWLLISLLRNSSEMEYKYPSMRLKEWKKGNASCDTIISITGKITDRRDKCLLIGDNAVCYFSKEKLCSSVKLGDIVEVVGRVFLNDETLQLNECKLEKRGVENVTD